MSTGFIITKQGVIVIEAGAGAYGALKEFARELVENGALAFNAAQDAEAARDFVQAVANADILGEIEVAGAFAFGTGVGLALTPINAVIPGGSIALGFLAGELYSDSFKKLNDIGSRAGLALYDLIGEEGDQRVRRPERLRNAPDDESGLSASDGFPCAWDHGQWADEFGQAEASAPPCPLVLDLNGDGTGTISVAAGAYFDHAADGFAEATGWVDAEDGLLVWDRDASDRIESGRELFGDQTLLQNGQLAANGFAALAEWDGNGDGKIDSTDSIWGELRVWKDVDGDGFSATNEFLSMAEAGVLSINLAYSAGSGVDANGNEDWLTGSFTRTDASIGEVTDYRFATDTVRSIAEDWLEVPAAMAALPDVSGFGKVYDLQQAMVRDTSGSLQGLVASFGTEADVGDRNALADQILLKWSGAETVDPASRGANIDARRLVALEAFMGRAFIGVGGSSNPNANAAVQLNMAYSNLFESVYAQMMAQTHLSDLYVQISYSWDAGSESVIGDLGAVKANLVAGIVNGDGSALLAAAEFVRTVKGMGAEDSLGLSSFLSTPALAGLLNGPFGVIVGGTSNDTLSSGTQVDLILGMAGDDSISTSGSNDIVHGGDGNDTITLQATGSYGSGAAHGGAGNDTITVASTHGLMAYQYQTISGGLGNDALIGSAGYETYLFGRGDGADAITDVGTSADRIVFGSGIAVVDIVARRVGDDMELRVADPGNPAADDRITVKNWFSNSIAKIEQLEFADGATLTLAQMEAQAAIITGTEGNDNLVGFTGNETYHGLGGNDTIQSGGGNDIVYGGAGEDTISDAYGNDVVYGGEGNDTITLATQSWGANTVYGEAGNDVITFVNNSYPMSLQTQTISGGTGNDTLNGSVGYDTYLYGRGDGADTVTDGGSTADKIVFGAGIALTDVAARRVGNDMELRVTDPGNPAADDRITVKNWFSSTTAKIELLQFADNSTLTLAQLEAQAAIITGTEGNDSLVGFNGHETYYGLGGNDSIQSGGGNDTVYGGAGDDTITDTSGADTVYGEDGNDVITLQAGGSYGGGTAHGGAGNDTISVASTSYSMQFQSVTISGGTGNDILNGSVGYDTYLYCRGDGADTIAENLLGGSAATDKIVFGAGIALADVTARRVSNDMELRVTDPGNPGADDRITVKNWYNGVASRIELLQFANSSTLTAAQLEAQAAIITGTEGNDSLVGFSGHETYYGLGGNDSIQSGNGNDTVYGGAGNDSISDTGGNDTVDGGDGDDVITLQANSAASGGGTAHGGAGNDTITISSTSYGMQFQSLTISGGTGNDILNGSVGYDTYLFGRGDGADTITENLLGGSTATDKIVFGAGIALADVTARRVSNDMELRVTDPDNPAADDRITIKNWYLSASYRVERLDFSDGSFVLGTNIIAGNETANTLTGTTGVDLLGGGAGNDVISGGAGNDAAHGGDGDDTVSGEDGNDFLYGDAGNDELMGGAGNDYVAGGAGNDSVDGGIGNDVLQGGDGDDQVQGGDGNDLVAGGSGADVLNGGDGNDLLAGSAGDDTINTGAGSNVISYNAGDGVDTVNAVAGASNTLSFGGGIGYDDLSLSKDGNDLVVSAGANDRVVLKDWYAGAASVLNLQIILDATAEFDANSSDPLYNKKVQSFDFAGLVSEFDDALAQSPGLTSWAVTNALLAFHLSGSDDAAIGGDLAYWYGKNNGFGGIGLAAAQQVIDGTGFGSDAQTLRPFSGLQEGLLKLS